MEQVDAPTTQPQKLTNRLGTLVLLVPHKRSTVSFFWIVLDKADLLMRWWHPLPVPQHLDVLQSLPDTSATSFDRLLCVSRPLATTLTKTFETITFGSHTPHAACASYATSLFTSILDTCTDVITHAHSLRGIDSDRTESPSVQEQSFELIAVLLILEIATRILTNAVELVDS